MTFIRYPGSKAKFLHSLIEELPAYVTEPLWTTGLSCYCEPFFGSGAIGYKVLHALTQPSTLVVINDLDPGIAAIWLTVLDAPRELCRRVAVFRPSASAFYECRDLDGAPGVDPTIRAFRKLVLHQTSFGGLGARAGGPLGGKEGKSIYNPACRWNPERICRKIMDWHGLFRKFKRVEVCNEDFAPVLKRLPWNAFVYLDPPYYQKGPDLYKYHMMEDDHVRLAEQLKSARWDWALSYDDHLRVRELYSWAHIRSFQMTSHMAKRKNSEIVITKRNPHGHLGRD